MSKCNEALLINFFFAVSVRTNIKTLKNRCSLNLFAVRKIMLQNRYFVLALCLTLTQCYQIRNKKNDICYVFHPNISNSKLYFYVK